MTDEYNLPDFRPPPGGIGQIDFQPNLRVGMPAPDFDLPLVDGGRLRLSDVTSTRHAALVFGCITSPVTATHLPELNRMWESFSSENVQFLFIYTGEIHPGERYPHHTSFEQKMKHAREFRKIEEVRFPVLVDGLDGDVHRTYGHRPNPVFVVNREGRLAFRAPSVEPPVLREYLSHLLMWDEVKRQGLPVHLVYTEQLRFQMPDGPMHDKVLQRAGPKAVREQELAHGPHPATAG